MPLCQKARAQNNDISVLRKIHDPAPLNSDKFFKVTGQTVTPISVATPLSYFVFAAFDKTHPIKNSVMFQNGITSTMCIVGSGLLSYGLKYTIKRERPWVTYPDVVPKDSPHTWSFPSGHTTFAFATATSVALIERKWYYTIPVYGWAFCVGYSRMHLGVHYPSDVIAGAVIGTGMSFAMYYLGQRIFR
ncbi:MAG TPA: phosphatase PAP2 family protein [Flavobacteriales bacterium]|nr:phosphatase PAP2 family protein [Flavobacteriales bacterium]